MHFLGWWLIRHRSNFPFYITTTTTTAATATSRNISLLIIYKVTTSVLELFPWTEYLKYYFCISLSGVINIVLSKNTAMFSKELGALIQLKNIPFVRWHTYTEFWNNFSFLEVLNPSRI
jgi:hypothetical protein